jgi:hypothetical protein
MTRLSLLVLSFAVVAVVGCGIGGSSSHTDAPEAASINAPAVPVGNRSPLILSRHSPFALTRAVQKAMVRRWPLVLRQGGAYAVFPSQTKQFERTGLRLALTNHIQRPGDGVIHYVDPRIVNLEAYYFGKYRCNHSPDPCPISTADQQAFLAAVAAELRKQRHNRSVVAYYVLDDYRGNIASVLAQVHAMVAAANRTLAHPRPTICGFGASLDFTPKNKPPGQYAKEYASLGHFTKLELLNFTPATCDMVQFYIYSFAHHAPVSDYSMQWTMPEMLAELRLRGWNPATTPVIGAPQAWEGVPPTAAQVRQQTAAFCAYGAQAIIAFTWRNFPPTGPKAQPELANSPDMRAGLSQGMRDCRRTWSTNSGSVSRGARSIIVPPKIRPMPLPTAPTPTST